MMLDHVGDGLLCAVCFGAIMVPAIIAIIIGGRSKEKYTKKVLQNIKNGSYKQWNKSLLISQIFFMTVLFILLVLFSLSIFSILPYSLAKTWSIIFGVTLIPAIINSILINKMMTKGRRKVHE